LKSIPGILFSLLFKSFVKRYHLVEFEDLKWFPGAVRDGITDYLRFFISAFDLYQPAVPVLSEVLEKCSTNTIVEVGAGGGGCIEKVIRHLDKINRGKVKVILTDVYPNLTAFKLLRKRSKGRIDFVPDSVDAADIPVGLKGVRTLFSAFHHFDHDEAKSVLKDAVRKNSPVCIFDAAERKFRYILGVIFSTLLFIFLVPLFTRPFRLSRMFYTYVIPMIPFFALFDGIVSMLRMYTPEELLYMAKEVDSELFIWNSGKVKHFPGSYVVYLTGYPKSIV
jgi:hypothetical protein